MSSRPDNHIGSRQLCKLRLTWEKKKTFDLGLDFRLWDRFYGTIDYYNTPSTT